MTRAKPKEDGDLGLAVELAGVETTSKQAQLKPRYEPTYTGFKREHNAKPPATESYDDRLGAELKNVEGGSRLRRRRARRR
jgi:hypothetical protein